MTANTPLLLDVTCQVCGHKWLALCPQGLESNANIECPRCGVRRWLKQ